MSRTSATTPLLIVLILLTSSLPAIAQMWEMEEVWGLAAGDMCKPMVTDIDGDLDLDIFAVQNHFNLEYVLRFENRFPEDWTDYNNAPPDPIIQFGDADYCDLDEDGDLDIIIVASIFVDSTSLILGWLENPGTYQDYELHVLRTNNEPGSSAVSVGDVDGDGDLDIVSRIGDEDPTILYQTAPLQFTPSTLTGLVVSSYITDLHDLNGDGYLDFFTYRNAGGDTKGLSVVFLEGGGNYSSQDLDVSSDYSGSGTPVWSEPYVIDYNHDGSYDAVSYRNFDWLEQRWDNTLSIWVNDGTGNFSELVVWDPADHFEGARYAAAAGDFDNDGDTDVAMHTYIAWNQGNDWSFNVSEPLQAGISMPTRIFDFDLDGDLDILTAYMDLNINPENDPPDVMVRLIPVNTTIPATGGNLIYFGMAASLYDQPGAGRVWNRVTGPDGTTVTLWSRTLNFPSMQWLEGGPFVEHIPAALPAGTYTMIVRAGQPGLFVAGADTLTFSKQD